MESLKQNVGEHFMWHGLLNTTGYLFENKYSGGESRSLFIPRSDFICSDWGKYSMNLKTQFAVFQKKKKTESLVERSWV